MVLSVNVSLEINFVVISFVVIVLRRAWLRLIGHEDHKSGPLHFGNGGDSSGNSCGGGCGSSCGSGCGGGD